MTRYFVSFAFTKGNNDYGYGNAQVARNEPITDFAEVMAIEKWLKGEMGAETVVVLNWQRFEEMPGTEEL